VTTTDPSRRALEVANPPRLALRVLLTAWHAKKVCDVAAIPVARPSMTARAGRFAPRGFLDRFHEAIQIIGRETLRRHRSIQPIRRLHRGP